MKNMPQISFRQTRDLILGSLYNPHMGHMGILTLRILACHFVSGYSILLHMSEPATVLAAGSGVLHYPVHCGPGEYQRALPAGYNLGRS